MKQVDVAVGVILRGGLFFVTKRADDLHQGGKWEFPGGKREPDETLEQALSRELAEEIGIQVLSQQPLLVIEHDYGDKQVRLDVRLVSEFSGEPAGQEGQAGQWVTLAALAELDFPAANTPIIRKLQRQLGPATD